MSGDRADARRRAEEALAAYDSGKTRKGWAPVGSYALGCIAALRALLAPEPASAEEGDRPSDDVGPWILCPDYTPGHPHTDCKQCGGFGAIPETTPAPPAQDAVREAAEPFEFIRAMAGAKCSWTPAEGTTSCDGFGGVCAGHQAERWLAARAARGGE